MEVIIEESIWSTKTKMPIRKAVFKDDGTKITRQLYIDGDSKKRNDKIDVIDHVRVSISEIHTLNPFELGTLIKSKLDGCFERNVNNEIPAFEYPIITRK